MGYVDEFKILYSAATGNKSNICDWGPFREKFGLGAYFILMQMLLDQEVFVRCKFYQGLFLESYGLAVISLNGAVHASIFGLCIFLNDG